MVLYSSAKELGSSFTAGNLKLRKEVVDSNNEGKLLETPNIVNHKKRRIYDKVVNI
jgi:hypothetical protein